MTRELRHGVARRLVPVVGVLLGLVLMHGLSGSPAGAAAHHPPSDADAPSMGAVATTVMSGSAEERPSDAAASAQGEVTVVGVWAEERPDDGQRPSMSLMGLCLALLTIIVLVLAASPSRPWAFVRRGTWPSVPRPHLAVRCRAPDLFALGVLRC